MLRSTFTLGAMIAATMASTGCASTYSNLVSGSNLGAQEYQPAVLVQPGKEEQYRQVLALCRNVAANRQVTAAQQGQLKTISGAVGGAVQGATGGLQIASFMKDSGFDTSLNRSAGLGFLAGLAGSLASSFSSGTQGTAENTRTTLLACLRSEAGNVGYRVLE